MGDTDRDDAGEEGLVVVVAAVGLVVLGLVCVVAGVGVAEVDTVAWSAFSSELLLTNEHPPNKSDEPVTASSDAMAITRETRCVVMFYPLSTHVGMDHG